MVRLFIVRHAKTAWNIGRIIQGRSDVPLSGEGRAAAKEAAKGFDGIKIDKVFCSPLVRATETAQLMLGLPYDTDERIIERDFGIYDGKDYSGMTAEEKNSLFYNLGDIAGAEAPEAVFARVRSFLCDIKKKYDGKAVAAFSHGVCLSFLLYAAKHDTWDAAKYEMDYVNHCEIKRIDI